MLKKECKNYILEIIYQKMKLFPYNLFEIKTWIVSIESHYWSTLLTPQNKNIQNESIWMHWTLINCFKNIWETVFKAYCNTTRMWMLLLNYGNIASRSFKTFTCKNGFKLPKYDSQARKFSKGRWWNFHSATQCQPKTETFFQTFETIWMNKFTPFIMK